MKKILTVMTVVLLLLAASTALCGDDPLKARVQEIEKAYMAGDLAPMITKYEKLVSENPRDAVDRYLLGIAYLYAEFKQENATFDKAYTEFTKAREIDPKMKYVNYSIGYILWAREQYDKAIDAYKAEIANDPSDGWNYYNLGQAYEGLKQWDKAISQYIMAIDKDRTIDRAYNNLGRLYLTWKGDYFRALDNFAKAVELKPNERLYKENYNVTIGKLRELKESLEKGQTELPPETVERLTKMDLKEMDLGTGAK